MKFNFESVLVEVIYLIGELESLQDLFPHHPCRDHFRYGKPRLHKLIIKQKEKVMSTTTAQTIYLSTPSTAYTVTALDQYGQPYLGDLSAATATSDTPANVGVTLGAFVDGVAPLTLTQAGGEGSALVTVADGAVTASLEVVSYVPSLASFSLAAVPPAPVAPAPAAS